MNGYDKKIKELLALADRYCAEHRIRRTTLGRQVANDGKFFDRIEAGGTCNMRTYIRIMEFFSEKGYLRPAADPHNPDGTS